MSGSAITLETIGEVRLGEDAHIRANRLPVLTGANEGSLNCGGCHMAIASGLSAGDFHERIQTDQRLVLECICGALNVVPKPDAE